MLNAAVIGLGWWGKILTQTLAPSDKITVVKLLDVDAEGGAAFAAEHGIDFTTDFAAVLADDNVDAVILATPHSLHEEQIIAAAGAGKHIFCEKAVLPDPRIRPSRDGSGRKGRRSGRDRS